MSANKLKFFIITSKKVIKANNKADAIGLAAGRRGVEGKVVSTYVDGERISATEARTASSE